MACISAMKCWHPEGWVGRSMTKKTERFQGDKLSTAEKESLEVQLLREAVSASMQVYD